MRKPRMYGAPAIRVFANSQDEWFYDVAEAVQFVKENWTHGKTLDARIQTGKYYEAIYTITEHGEIYASPLYAELLLSAPVKMGTAV